MPSTGGLDHERRPTRPRSARRAIIGHKPVQRPSRWPRGPRTIPLDHCQGRRQVVPAPDSRLQPSPPTEWARVGSRDDRRVGSGRGRPGAREAPRGARPVHRAHRPSGLALSVLRGEGLSTPRPPVEVMCRTGTDCSELPRTWRAGTAPASQRRTLRTRSACPSPRCLNGSRTRGVELRGKSGPHVRSYADVLTREFLNEMYVNDGRAASDIAADLGCSESTVRNWLRRHRLPVRPMAARKRAYVIDAQLLDAVAAGARSVESAAVEAGCCRTELLRVLRRSGRNLPRDRRPPLTRLALC